VKILKFFKVSRHDAEVEPALQVRHELCLDNAIPA
jgi:hypothetical protein